MSFELTNILTSFVDLVNRVFQPYLNQFVVVFIENKLIYSKNKEKRENRVRIVLQLLREKRLYAKLKKFDFWLEHVCLGHIISKEGVSVEPMKVRPYHIQGKSISRADESRGN